MNRVQMPQFYKLIASIFYIPSSTFMLMFFGVKYAKRIFIKLFKSILIGEILIRIFYLHKLFLYSQKIIISDIPFETYQS